MNARESFRMCELVRDYMGGPSQSKALKPLPSVEIAAGRKSDSQLPAGCQTDGADTVTLANFDPVPPDFLAERQDRRSVAVR